MFSRPPDLKRINRKNCCVSIGWRKIRKYEERLRQLVSRWTQKHPVYYLNDGRKKIRIRVRTGRVRTQVDRSPGSA